LSHPVENVVQLMRRSNLHRAYMVWDTNTQSIRASHSLFYETAKNLEGNHRDYQQHEAIFLEIGKESGTLLGAFLHKTIRGQGAGGIRQWKYKTLNDFIMDGLRLSEGMGRKNALAGLWWGGGKGVLQGLDNRDKSVYRDYGRFVTSLKGCYVTAEDLGTKPEDMREIYMHTRFTTCIPPDVGGSGNPSHPTGRGVVCGMNAAMEFLGTSLEGKSIAIQGCGNVATYVMKYLIEKSEEDNCCGYFREFYCPLQRSIITI